MVETRTNIAVRRILTAKCLTTIRKSFRCFIDLFDLEKTKKNTNNLRKRRKDDQGRRRDPNHLQAPEHVSPKENRPEARRTGPRSESEQREGPLRTLRAHVQGEDVITPTSSPIPPQEKRPSSFPTRPMGITPPQRPSAPTPRQALQGNIPESNEDDEEDGDKDEHPFAPAKRFHFPTRLSPIQESPVRTEFHAEEQDLPEEMEGSETHGEAEFGQSSRYYDIGTIGRKQGRSVRERKVAFEGLGAAGQEE